MSELFFRLDLAFSPLGPLAWPTFALLAVALVGVTAWTYSGRARLSRRRFWLLVTLRLLALLVALLTALRPSVGVREVPKVPSVLLIGVDVSETMTIPDEFNNQRRIDAVRDVLKRCEPILDELRSEQGVEVVTYAFGDPRFAEATGRYTPDTPADQQRSDYGAYLRRTFERWQSEPYFRAHILIGDGIDNGAARPDPEALRWRQAGRGLQTFSVGSPATDSGTKDVALTALSPTTGSAEGSVFIKSDFTLRLRVNAFGFVGARVPVKVQFDLNDGAGYKDVATQETTLGKETDNEVDLKLKAPNRPGQIKVRVEIPVASVTGDIAPSNNVIETYLNVTKEGIRVLMIGRLTVEFALIRKALDDPRIDLYKVERQTDEPALPGEREWLDFDKQAYDVIIIGNVSAKQLTTLDPQLPAKIRDQVTKRGVGVLFTGGHATLGGTPKEAGATGWRGVKEIEEILPVDLSRQAPLDDAAFDRPTGRFQYVPTARFAGDFLNRIAPPGQESLAAWRQLNAAANKPVTRLAGLSRMGMPKPLAITFAVASDAREDVTLPLPLGQESKFAPLLVGHQIGDGDRGRVLAFAGMDTYFWRGAGLPKSPDGQRFHTQFWRQLVRWLAHQDEDEGQVFVKPQLPRLPVGGQQTLRLGVRQAGGTPAKNVSFPVVKVVAPGENPAGVASRAYFPDPDGSFRVPFEPQAPGEYTVLVTGEGTDSQGAKITGEATARFLVYANVTDEMLVKGAKPEVLQRLAAASGGTARRLDELPAYLRELKAQPIEVAKPRPKYYPNWGRDQSQGFLPAWLALFVLLLAAEWGLRRWWGLV